MSMNYRAQFKNDVTGEGLWTSPPKKITCKFFSIQKVLDFERASIHLKLSALDGLISNKPVSYKTKNVANQLKRKRVIPVK